MAIPSCGVIKLFNTVKPADLLRQPLADFDHNTVKCSSQSISVREERKKEQTLGPAAAL